MTRGPQTQREVQLWTAAHLQGVDDGMRAMLRLIVRRGWQVTLGEIAAETGLTVERVGQILDEIQRAIR